jgi:predicted Zn finger-like uncharacterized protein
MAFAVVCKSCQSRFLLNDDLLKRKVAGKVVTVRCRQCHTTIEVDASNVDATTLPPQPLADEAAPAVATPALAAPTVPRPMTLKAAPSPPRPAKSQTLIGIGGPARPAGSTELVALSPGLMNMRKPAPVEVEDFPEPPPPPSVLEDLSADDWEITETPPLPRAADATPESVDDFIEELPPSVPMAGDDEPTRMIPAKAMLERAEQEAAQELQAKQAKLELAKPVVPDLGAPTIDVSTLSTQAAPKRPSLPTAPARNPSVDLMSGDVPLTGKGTLPLFALDDSHAATFPAPAPRPRPPQPAPSPAEGSLSPASLDPPAVSERVDSVRTRKNVVAPATKSEPPLAPRPRRSGLAVPIVLGLAAAAGLLIWKRGAMPAPATTAQSEQVAPAPERITPPPLAVADAPAAPASGANLATAVAAADDDITFETNPSAPSRKTAPNLGRPEPAATPHDAVAPVAPTPAAPEPETPAAPAKPEAKERPVETPSGPVGDFDPAAAAAALTSGAAQASSCRKDGDPSGVASVIITFAPSGRVTSANVSGPPYAGTPTGGCIAAVLRKARVPPFEGDRVTVSKTIVIQ